MHGPGRRELIAPGESLLAPMESMEMMSVPAVCPLVTREVWPAKAVQTAEAPTRSPTGRRTGCLHLALAKA